MGTMGVRSKNQFIDSFFSFRKVGFFYSIFDVKALLHCVNSLGDILLYDLLVNSACSIRAYIRNSKKLFTMYKEGMNGILQL